jgi:hypothetical protein
LNTAVLLWFEQRRVGTGMIFATASRRGGIGLEAETFSRLISLSLTPVPIEVIETTPIVLLPESLFLPGPFR